MMIRSCAPMSATVPRLISMALLVLVVWLSVGCAGVQPGARPEPSDRPSETVKSAAVVASLPDGREGFLIRETAQLDLTSRADFDRAAGLLRSGEYAQAIDVLETVVEQSPGVSAPYINLAIAYQHEGKTELAETQLKKALELVPGHPVASNVYGLLCRQEGRFDEARAIYENSLAAFPGYPPICRNLGILCELYLNDLDAALQQFEIYSQAVPEDEQVQLWLVDLRARLGR